MGLKAGVAIADISPMAGLELAGYPHHPRHNEGIHDPLYASCICLDDGDTRLALVSLDLLMYSKKEVQAVREEIARRTPIPAAHVSIFCSHTHSGPWTSGRLDKEALENRLGPDVSYLSKLRGAIVSLVERAWTGRFDARVGIAKGVCGREKGVGGNRRDPSGIADPEVWTVGVKDGAGALRGCLVKYALHPTFLHSDNLLVSADYPGCVRKLFTENSPGTVFLFGQGCSGNQSPRYFRSGKTYEEAERVGRLIGDVALAALRGARYETDLGLCVRTTEVDLETRILPSRAQAEKTAADCRIEWERVKAQSSEEREIWNAELRFLGAEDTLGYVMVRERGEALSLRDDELPAEVQVIGVGGARIVFFPGEAFVEFGITVQYRSPFIDTFVISVANGCLPGYACTEQAYAEGGYEAGTSLLTGSAGEQLVDAATVLLKQSRGAR